MNLPLIHIGCEPIHDIDDVPSYRRLESARRSAMLQRHSDNCKANRSAWITAFAFAAIIVAVLACYFGSRALQNSPPLGAGLHTAPVLTPDTAPVRWRKKDFPAMKPKRKAK